MVNYSEQFWYTFSKFPSAQQIFENVDDYTSTAQINRDLELPHVIKQLEVRGVDTSVCDSPTSRKGLRPRKTQRLDERQIAAIHTLLNTADNRSMQRKLSDLGIAEVTFQGWLKNKKFMEYYRTQAESMLQEGLPAAHVALIQQAAKGNLRAIEFYYKLTGYFTGAESEELMNMKLFIHKIIEIIQKKVDDPEVLKSITGEMLLLVGINDSPPVAKDLLIMGEIEDGSNN